MRRRYSPEFKAEVVKLVLEQAQTIRDVSHNLKISIQTQHESREEARREIVEWIEIFYNRVHRHTKLC